MKDEEIITKLAKQYDFIYSPNVAASENFDEDKYANTTDVTLWKDLIEDGKIQLSTGSLVRNITLNFCQPFAIGDSGPISQHETVLPHRLRSQMKQGRPGDNLSLSQLIKTKAPAVV